MLDIKWDELENRVYVLVEGQECVLNFRNLSPEVVEFYRTFVPENLRNRGIAAELIKFGLEKAREQNKKVLPTCGYVNTYMKRHPEWNILIA